MPARSFFDTNVLIYADDKAVPAKQSRALTLVAEHRRAGTGVVSMQVLQEYFVTVTRKLRVDAAIARRKLNSWRSSTSPHRNWRTFWLRSICIDCTAFPSGTRWSSVPPSSRVALCCSRKTCRIAGRSMGCGLLIRSGNGTVFRVAESAIIVVGAGAVGKSLPALSRPNLASG